MGQLRWLRVLHDCCAMMKREADSALLRMKNSLHAALLADKERNENARRCQDDDPDRCIEGCTSLIQSGEEPNNNLSRAFNNRGLALGLRGELDRAIRDFDQALKLNPNYAEALRNRGEAYRLKDLYDLAIQDYDRALRLEPDHARAFNGRGNAHESNGDLHRAIRDYKQAVRLNPDYDSALNNLAWLYATAADRTLRNPAKALECALRAVALNGANNADDLDTLAEAYFINRDYLNAIMTEKKAVALQPDSAIREEFEQSLAKYEQAYELAHDKVDLRQKGWTMPQHESQLSI